MRGFSILCYLFEIPKQPSFLDYTERFLDANFEYILNYTSNVIKITKDNVNYFFKEARKRPSCLRICIYESIDYFFDEIVCNISLKEKIIKSLTKRKNYQKLINMGQKNISSNRLNRYLISGDASYLGLPNLIAEEEKKQLRKFIFYLYGELQNWFYNLKVKKGMLQTFSAVRSLSTQELAKLLGVEELIPHCEFVKININGRIKYGVLSEQAPGEMLTSYRCEQRASRITPQLLRSLTNLNLLDVLTRDNDHRVGNYHVVLDDLGKYLSVLSFDNDGPSSFGLSANVRFINLIGCSTFINKKGIINRAHLDSEVASALQKIEKKDLRTLIPYLSNLQLWFLWLRISKVKKAISKTLRLHDDFLLMPNEWREEHIRQDLSAKYKKTYLASLLLDCYYETGLHDFDTL